MDNGLEALASKIPEMKHVSIYSVNNTLIDNNCHLMIMQAM